MNIFKEMFLSVYSYGTYKEFLKNKKFKVFGFGVVLILIYYMVTLFIPTVINLGSSDSMADMVRRELPDFRLEDGYLYVPAIVDYDENGMKVYINTDIILPDADEMEERFESYSQVMMIDMEKMIIKNRGQVQEIYLASFGDDVVFDREDLLKLVPFVRVFIYIFLVIAYFWMTAWFFFGALIVALIGMIVAACMKCRLSFGKIYLLAIYSRTLPLLIKAAVSFLPFEIPFFWVINFGLSVLILALAMKKMQTPDPDQFTQYQSSYNDYMQ